MELMEQLHRITGDNSISKLDELFTHKLGEDEYVALYETRSDYLYMVHVLHGKIEDVCTYESLGVLDGAL